MWFDPVGSIAVLLLALGIPFLSEKLTKSSITKEHLANQELMKKDILNNVSHEQIERYIQNGRYYIPREITSSFPEPHRNPKSGKIIIENDDLYHDDAWNNGAVYAENCVKQGKYNLTEEEKIKQNLKGRQNLRDSSGFDYKNTKAAIQWKAANDKKNVFVENHIKNIK